MQFLIQTNPHKTSTGIEIGNCVNRSRTGNDQNKYFNKRYLT